MVADLPSDGGGPGARRGRAEALYTSVVALLTPIAASDRDVLSQLLSEYLRELAALVNGDWDPDAYPFLDAQWTEVGRHPLFIRASEEIVGLALVRDPMSTGSGLNQMADFYVKPAQRGTGLAARAARAIFKRFPGRWELQVHDLNKRGIEFWLRCIEEVSTVPPKTRLLDFQGELKHHYLFDVA